ncbi:hypothetical protein MAHJHV33_48460 [Mycobacterium avium subsp. hominissuis]
MRWVHRHVLRLGGWTIVRSARDEVVLAAQQRPARGELTLRRHDDRRAALTTRVRYRRPIAARRCSGPTSAHTARAAIGRR